MTRREGSGFSGPQADAVAELIASHLRGGSSSEIEHWVEVLDQQRDLGRFGLPGETVSEWTAALLDELGLSVGKAQALAPGGLGDIEVELSDGTSLWIEVKSQSKKANFRDLTQADWVRNETDALRKLLLLDEPFRDFLSEPTLDGLTMLDAGEALEDWRFEDLWLADVALLYSTSRRLMAGVTSPMGINGFLDRKFLVHLTKEGMRSVRLSDIPAVKDVQDGRKLHRKIKRGRVADAIVWVSTEEFPRQGMIDFIYSVGYLQNDGTSIGRHKMNAHAIERSNDVVVSS